MENIGSPPVGGDRNRAPTVVVTESVLISIATILVGLRHFVRTRIVKKAGWDDYFILLALLCAIAGFGTGVVAIHHGVGRHAYYLSKQQQIDAAKFQVINQTCALVSLMFTKISIAVFLLRFFVTDRRWKFFLHFMILAPIVFNLPLTVLQLARCRPMEKIWDPSVPGKCVGESSARYNEAQGISGVIIDLTLAVVPVVFLWKVNIKLETKIGLWVLMGLGLLATACTIVRIITLNNLEPAFYVDPTWSILGPWLWGILEELLGIIAATIPTLRPLFTRDLRQRRRIYSYSSQVNGGNPGRRLKPTYIAPDPFGLESQVEDVDTRHAFDNTSEEVILPLRDVHDVGRSAKISIDRPPEL